MTEQPVSHSQEPPCWAALGWGWGSGESPTAVGGTGTSQSSLWEEGGVGTGQQAAKSIPGCEACGSYFCGNSNFATAGISKYYQFI